MKLKAGIRSLLVMFVMALVFTVAAPSVLPNVYSVQAAKKKSSKKKAKAKVNLKISKDMASVKVGKSVALKVTGNAKKTVKWSTTNNCVKLSKKTGNKIKVKGVKDGVAAVVAKVGGSKVVCCVYVGNGAFSDANAKTRNAIGNPIRLLAAYVAQHPITVQSGNEDSDYSPTSTYSGSNVYGLRVEGANLVVERIYTYTRQSTNKAGTYTYTYGGTNKTRMSIPVDGSPVATIAYEHTYNRTGTDVEPYSSGETYAFTININTITPGTEIQYIPTYTYSDSTPETQTEASKTSFYEISDQIVDVLHCLLTDNKTGFTAKDIGFAAYTPSHRYIGLLTNEDLANFAAQMASVKAYNQAHYKEYDDDDED